MYELEAPRTEFARVGAAVAEPKRSESQVTEEMVQTFCESYSASGFYFPDPKKVRAALQAALGESSSTDQIESQEPQDGFAVYRVGVDGMREAIGYYSELLPALRAARSLGMAAEVAASTRDLYEVPVLGRRWDPLELKETVGFLDLRDFEYGTRNGSGGPVRHYGGNGGSIRDRMKVNVAGPNEVRDRLLQFSSLVGVWRRKGDPAWRGEFRGDDQGLDSWLPPRKQVLALEHFDSEGFENSW